MAALLRLLIAFVSLATRLLLKLRLGVPLLYTILMVTVFDEWAAAHNALAVGILIAMVATIALSWVVSLVRRVKAI